MSPLEVWGRLSACRRASARRAARKRGGSPEGLPHPGLSAIFLAALLCLPLHAQRYAHISGSILDPSGSGVPGATVSAVNEETGFRRLTESQPDGSYLIASVQPGVYKLTVRKEGFRTVIRLGVRLDRAAPARVDFTLAVGSVHEVITVRGAPPLLASEDASAGALIGREEIEHLPLNGRGLLSLIEMAPATLVTPAAGGEAGQFTTNGQRPNTHYFTVDGVSANTGVSAGGSPAQSTGGALPGMTAFGSLHSLVSLEALEEFRIQTSTTVPEFGRLPGAQVALASRSGSDEFHASLFEEFRHERLSANDWFANRHGDPRAPLRLNNFGGSLGGPLWRQHSFFFLAYEGMRLRQPFAGRVPVPSRELRRDAPDWAQPLLGLFPPPNGPELGGGLAEWSGRAHRPSRLDVGSVRLDHAFTPRLTMFARYNAAPSSNEFGAIQVNRLDLRSHSLTAGLNMRVRPDIILDLRANASSASARSRWGEPDLPACYLEPATSHLVRAEGSCDQLVRFSIAGLGTLASGHEGDRRQTQLHIVQTGSLDRGSHSLRLGLDYRRLAPSRYDAAGTLGIIADSIEDLVAASNLWIASSEPQSSSTVLKEISVYLQDTWRATPRFTATYGLRWEISSAPVFRPSFYADSYAGYIVPLDREVWAQRHVDLAPRLGFAIRPRAEGRTVVRAGAGLYYDSSLSIATDLLNGGPFNVSQFGSGRHAPFNMLLTFGFTPDLRLPLVMHYNASVERALGRGDVVSLGYAGSAGHHLLRREIGGPGSTELVWLALATNNGASRYNSLQAQYRRRLARSLTGIASYTWSHSLDDSSSDSAMHWAGLGIKRRQDRGSSDFDVRHSFHAALTYQAPRGKLKGWALDSMFRARTGFPMTILNAEQFTGLSFANAFRPDLVGGAPVWIRDPSLPGGRRLNPDAFRATPDYVQGGLGRNAVSGFGMSQLDLALRREFALGERRSLELRIEGFNALNQANFADPVRFVASPMFGESPSMLNVMLGTGSPGSGLAPMFQMGGARSVEIAVRFKF